MPIRARRPAVLFAAAVLLASVAAVQGRDAQRVPSQPDEATILHVLNRVAYGPRPGDIARVRAMGLEAYIEQQLHPERIDDSRLDPALAAYPTLTMTTEELAAKYYRPLDKAQREARAAGDNGQPKLSPEAQALRQGAQSVLQNLMQARVVRAVDSERQLNEVLVDFWFNHFNVYAQKGAVNEYLNSYERDAIRPYVLGNFRDMLGAVAHHPAMLFYLDNFQSVNPNMSARRNRPRAMPRGLNENYARELMELHTLGVDGGYTQKDVQEVARVFTGWTIDQPRGGGRFVFRPEWHDPNAKTVLGQTISGHAGVDGMREGERVLDILALHPKTARHLAYQLAQRFVSDTPPASLVDRVAWVYLDTKGDLRATTRAVLTSPEFFAEDAVNAKVKTPLDFAISALRATNASIASAAPVVQALRTTLGMPLYGCQPPTGYSTTADAWVNTGALLARMNFGVALVGSQQRGLRVDVRALAPDTSDASRTALVDAVLAGRVSPTTAATLAKAETPAQMVALLLGSPEFQKR